MKMVKSCSKIFSRGLLLLSLLLGACQSEKVSRHPGPDEILGNTAYQAIAYGGFRNQDRSVAPSLEQIKEDLRLLHAMNIKVVRTYHARLYEHAPRVLQAINELKEADADFEMYVMLGTWMQCKNAFSPAANHSLGDSLNNSAEIAQAIALAQKYPDIVRVIAVGNEAMVHWAQAYFVQPEIILKWVQHLRQAREDGKIPAHVWITSSDNYASWGGESDYHGEELEELIKSVDYLSIHSYPFHDTHYNPEFWYVPEGEENLSTDEQLKAAIKRAINRVEEQYLAVANYLDELGLEKEIHIGETGWASADNVLYGAEGSRAASPYNQYLYYQAIRSWCDSMKISCFYFEAFDEPWKDGKNPEGSENHFGLFNVAGQAKPAIHSLVSDSVFKGLGRNGQVVALANNLILDSVRARALPPPRASAMPQSNITYPEIHSAAKASKMIIMVNDSLLEAIGVENIAYPQSGIKINPWEGTCRMEWSPVEKLVVIPLGEEWWGCALEQTGAPEDYSAFAEGYLHLELKGQSAEAFKLGLLSGHYAKGNQKRGEVSIGPGEQYELSGDWQKVKIPMSELSKTLDLDRISAPLFLQGTKAHEGDQIIMRNIYFSTN